MNDPVTTANAIQVGMSYTAAQLPLQKLTELGYNIVDVMLHCKFDGVQCKP